MIDFTSQPKQLKYCHQPISVQNSVSWKMVINSNKEFELKKGNKFPLEYLIYIFVNPYHERVRCICKVKLLKLSFKKIKKKKKEKRNKK